ncbi:putative polyketide synthase [Fusarium flagelliforme]|uniref:Putative polyketide synthase n=1 Tax=Fusarium flagelliforme TaxID=2675880 RepID=A0A395M5U3_9HYPO|nr:putative polyketide synthase [Fusarium flagelliforme]
MEDDIAVVGIGLRFPGDASSPEELWKVLERGESQWSEFPKDRLNIDGYYHPGGDRQGSISFRGAHFIKGDFAAFDASFFSVAAEDAKAIDPQQRILLEASYEALENDYEQVCLRDPDWQPQYAATGNGIAIMANRISYFFNLHGPSMTIDTGCSGSLVSVHLAAQSLRTGETSLAIAAGAGMILTPNTMMPMTALNFLSPDGKCFTFDSRANGYGRGEGIGVVVMKRLSDALRDNDTIRAVIRATKVNQDGHTTGITLPSKEAQVRNINSIYESAGLDFNQTAYVECHGTGTKAGDWRELKAISESLGSVRDVDNPIVVGSIKPNIGHLEGAAGVAGLIKGVLTLEHAKIPPNINFDKANPDIDFETWKVKVPTKMLDWPLPGLRRVSVNCFGFGGTNAHVIMDEAPRYLTARGLKGNHNSLEASDSASKKPHRKTDSNPQLFLYSAHEKSGVGRIIESHLSYLNSNKEADGAFLQNYAYTLGCRRSSLEWKHAVVAESREDLIANLQNINDNLFKRTSRNKQPKICFLFCGQGAQYAQMGKDLLNFEVFRDAMEAASRYMKVALGSQFDLLEEILQDQARTRISDARIAQPATTAVQMALVDLFDSFQITPSFVVGHSSGEIAAAYASGALTKQAAWEVAYYRGVAASSLATKCPPIHGSMMVAGLQPKDIPSGSKGSKAEIYRCQVACINSPRSVTLSGRGENIQYAYKELTAKGIFCRILPVQVAYHSTDMTLVEKEYKSALGLVSPCEHRKPVTMFSTVSGNSIDGSKLDKGYWASNLTHTVLFMSAINNMLNLPPEDSPDIFLELSPTSTLRSPVADIINQSKKNISPVFRSALSHKAHGSTSLKQALAELWASGYKFDIEKVIAQYSYEVLPKCLADLPPYPWNHNRSYWHESHLGEANRFREFPRQDLIGAPTADAISYEPRWRGFLRISENPWIQDHQVQKTIIYPAAGMVTMALQGASQLAKDTKNLLGFEILNMRIEKAMIVPNTAHGLEMAMNFKRISTSGDQQQDTTFEFCIYSKQLDSAWEQNATGCIETRYKRGHWQVAFHQYRKKFESFKTTCKQSVVPRQLYELLDIVGMNYGPTFRNITHILQGNSSCVTKIRIPDTRSKMPAKFEYDHLIHPATLDSMFQTPFAISNEPMVPTFIKSIFVSADISRDLDKGFDGYSTATRIGLRDASTDIAMTQSCWDQPSVVVSGLHFTGIANSAQAVGGFLPNNRNLCTQVSWIQDITCSRSSTIESLVTTLAHKFPGLSILQVGGSSYTALDILRALDCTRTRTPWFSRYTLGHTAGSKPLKKLSLVEGTHYEHFIENRVIDGSEPLPEYDLIIVCDQKGVDTPRLLAHLKRPGFLLESLPPGEFDPVDKEVVAHSYQDNSGQAVEMKFSIHRADPVHDWFSVPDVVILLANESLPEARSLAGKLIVERYTVLQIHVMHLSEVMSQPNKLKGKIVISLLDFTADNSDAYVYNWSETEFNAFHTVHQLAKGILWVSRGAHMEPMNPKGAPIIALARTLNSEDPLKLFVTFDLNINTPLDSPSTVKSIDRIFLQSFAWAPGSRHHELEFAEKNGAIFVPRLVPIESLNDIVEKGSSHNTTKVSFHSYPRHLKLQVVQPGLVNNGLMFTAGANVAPQPGEVEIVFESAPLNFHDLDTVMGRTWDSEIGTDICGRVRRVGRNVSGFMLGDRVCGIIAGGSVQSNVNVDSRFVAKRSSNLPLSQCISAYHCLVHVGRLGRGKSVLIHAGASTFGLAALSIAAHLCADVFVTVMGHDTGDQRDCLLNLGIKKSHILNADTDNFTAILRDRVEKGVDLVYNPTQKHLEANLKCVRHGGTIIQFASKSPNLPSTQLGSATVSIINLDLTTLMNNDAEYVAELIEEVVKCEECIEDRLVVAERFIKGIELPNITEALKLIDKSPLSGLVSVTAPPEANPMVEITTLKPVRTLHQVLSRTGTYLLAGGLGGLGRSICDLLVRNGAQHVAFLSRSGASSESSHSFIEDLKAKGVDARVYKVDICDIITLARVVKEQICREMPPIKGVFQCAAVIRDSIFANMTYSDWMEAVKPKTIGSDNLVQVVSSNSEDPLFIFLASSAGVIGNRGQANYAAGNCFEDALAQKYRLQGRYATSIDLGPVLSAGMLAEDDGILDMLRASGFYGIRHQDFLTVVSFAITGEITPEIHTPSRIVMGIGSGGLIRQNQPADPYWSRTALYSYLNLVDMAPPDLSAVDGSAKFDLKSLLACCASIDAAAGIITIGLTHMLAKAMNMLPEEIDTGKPPNVYGVDSLVAVGVRNWVVTNCSVEVSVFEVLSDKTVAELAMEIASKGGFGAEGN